MVGVIAAIIVLLVVFGSLIAGVTPIVMGIFAIATALGVVGLLGAVWRFSFFVPQLISMMGLAVGIDYSLFIVSRYREERPRGRDNLEAIGRSGATANRAVFFSGLTVVLALAGMLLVPTTIFRGLAGGAIIVVLISIGAVDDDAARDHGVVRRPPREAGLGCSAGAGRSSTAVRAGSGTASPAASWRRPVVWLVVAAGFMLLLSIPYWAQSHPDDDGRGIKTGFSGTATIPEGIQTQDAFDILVAKFPERRGGQATADVVIPGAADRSAVAAQIERPRGGGGGRRRRSRRRSRR